MESVFITSEYITLGQFLKFLGKISNGGEAKIFINNNKIMVNDEEETRRGRKIYPNDVVFIDKEGFLIKKDEDQ